MTAIIISKWVADGIVKDGIYDLLIDVSGNPFLSSKVEYVNATTTLELCQRDLEVINVNDSNTVGELKAKLKKLGKYNFINNIYKCIYIGYLFVFIPVIC